MDWRVAGETRKVPAMEARRRYLKVYSPAGSCSKKKLFPLSRTSSYQAMPRSHLCFETWDTGNLTLTAVKKPEMLEYEYARSALRNGLKLAAKLGVYPFKIGLLGSTAALGFAVGLAKRACFTLIGLAGGLFLLAPGGRELKAEIADARRTTA